MFPDISKEHSSTKRRANVVEIVVGRSQVYGLGYTDVALKREVLNHHPSFSNME
jgi:hypothetical protein